jgi:hypothetical protein
LQVLAAQGMLGNFNKVDNTLQTGSAAGATLQSLKTCTSAHL